MTTARVLLPEGGARKGLGALALSFIDLWHTMRLDLATAGTRHSQDTPTHKFY